MADRHLRESDRARHGGNRVLVLGITVGMQEDDGEGVDAILLQPLKYVANLPRIERRFDSAVRTHAFVDFDHVGIQKLRFDDLLGKDIRSRLVADLKRIAEAAGGDENRPLTFALQ